ncbi:hypothetical protein [Thermophagus xiamenensis]|uniref:N-acetyltransferase domain-containing protein n=1 Tax=Thermophagus xiamenensis TaxID=385682 RepID=A0A1I1VXQ4_9BACT|nr:hypothetical protein [Thermophagus xiamenensis]SFD85813.1 hypothetical protein SAMN05444380_10341 [Thermophagus xiamenensis]
MDYIIKQASKFSKDEINRFKKIVTDAGQVKKETFDGLIDRDPILLFIPDTSKIEAVGALKVPHVSYKNKVFCKSKSGLNPEDFDFEIGWIVSLNKGKGLGKMVTEVLTNCKPNIYATVREDNSRMRQILEMHNFKKSGDSFKSDRGDYKIVLYVKS